MRNTMRLAVCMILVSPMVVCAQEPASIPITVSSLAQKYAEYSRDLQSLEKRHSDNARVLLGLGFLYEVNGLPQKVFPADGAKQEPYRSIEDNLIDPAEFPDIVADLYTRAMRVDPTNRAARATLARRCVQTSVSKRRVCMEELDALVGYAKKFNQTTVDVPRHSELYVLLGKYGSHDLAATLEEVKDRLAERDRKLLVALDESHGIDPNNALYNYLKAQILFAADDSQNAVRELEKAAQTPRWDNYMTEAGEARAMVLREVGFPENYMSSLTQKYPVHADSLMRNIWPKLKSTGEASVARGDTATALEINGLIAAMAKHIKEERRPHGGAINQGIAQQLEEYTEHRRNLLQDKTREKE